VKEDDVPLFLGYVLRFCFWLFFLSSVTVSQSGVGNLHGFADFRDFY